MKIVFISAILALLEGALLAANRPNIVVIMADDLGYADVGFQGCQDISTPNIDQLANEGARFSQGYVTGCMCGPSRAGFITGRIQSTFGYYKMLVHRGKVQLFDLKDDPGESTDLAEAQPRRVERMLTEWKSWNKNNVPPLWNSRKRAKDVYQYADYEWLKGTPHYRAKK